MKRLLLSSLAGLMFVGSFGLPALAQSRGSFSSQRSSDNRDDRGGRPGQPNGQAQYQQQYHGQNSPRGGDYNRNRTYADNRGNDHRYDNRYEVRHDWREDHRWDHRDWRRGERLGDWNRRYYEVDYRDYRDYRLYNPPNGYRWVRDDNGNFLLAALAGGLIAAIIANN